MNEQFERMAEKFPEISPEILQSISISFGRLAAKTEISKESIEKLGSVLNNVKKEKRVKISPNPNQRQYKNKGRW